MMEEWKIPTMAPQELADLKERANEYWWLPNRPAKADYIKENLMFIVEGHGCRVRDAEGKEYLEMTSSDWVASVGYGREEVAKIAYEQLLKMPHVDPFGQQKLAVSTIDYATELVRVTPGNLNRVFTISGGSEANESALKLSRLYQARVGSPKRFKFISRRLAYHGATMGCQGLSHPVGLFPPYLNEPMPPGFLHVAHPYCYRCEFGLEYPACELLCAKQLEQIIQYEHPSTVAAVVMEPVSPPATVAVPPPEYFPMIRKICDDYGVLFIADEVATGFGRTGKWFGLNHWDVVPDIMTMDKGISGGYLPLSAVAVKEEIAAKFVGTSEDAFPHGHTWWGHAVVCAVGLAIIRIIEREGLVENAARMGAYFLDGLHSILDQSPLLGNIQGLGLLLGIELVQDKKTKEPLEEPSEVMERFRDKLLERGLICHGRFGRIMLWPPLIVTKAEIDEVLRILEESIRELEKEVRVA